MRVRIDPEYITGLKDGSGDPWYASDKLIDRIFEVELRDDVYLVTSGSRIGLTINKEHAIPVEE